MNTGRLRWGKQWNVAHARNIAKGVAPNPIGGVNRSRLITYLFIVRRGTGGVTGGHWANAGLVHTNAPGTNVRSNSIATGSPPVIRRHNLLYRAGLICLLWGVDRRLPEDMAVQSRRLATRAGLLLVHRTSHEGFVPPGISLL